MKLSILALLFLTCKGVEPDESFYSDKRRRNLGHGAAASTRSTYSVNYYAYDTYYVAAETSAYVDKYNYLTNYKAPTTYVAPPAYVGPAYVDTFAPS